MFTFVGKATTDILVNEGDLINLQCGALSNPPPFNYHWRHDGQNRIIRHSGLLPSELIFKSIKR